MVPVPSGLLSFVFTGFFSPITLGVMVPAPDRQVETSHVAAHVKLSSSSGCTSWPFPVYPLLSTPPRLLGGVS